MGTESKSVMVVGGGIAGLTAAWELARRNIQVTLIDKAEFLGGHAIQYCCKATDTCQQCGACSVEQMLKNVAEADNITCLLTSEIDNVTNNAGFTAQLKKSADSAGQLPAQVYHQMFYESEKYGYSKNHALIKAKIPAEIPASIKADAIVLASGFAPFNPVKKSTYGYSRHQNVISGLELEKIKRTHGELIRPSDGRVPAKVAFIQCVGSRDERLGNLWCSQVCCPYALRTARTVKHANPETEVTVFYMDIQNTGNNFPDFYAKCRDDFRFIRNIPVDIYPMENDRLRIRYMDENNGEPVDDIFDLVVLSIGIMPNEDNTVMAEKFGLTVDQDGFMRGKDLFYSTLTEKPGVFLAGTIEGPKTIAGSMAHAGQAVNEVMKYLGGAQ